MTFRKLIFAALTVLPMASFAESHEDFGFPSGIDLETTRSLLGEAFPVMETTDNSGRLDALIAYRRALELYRAIHLEGYNSRILDICRELNRVERRVSAASNRGDLAPNVKDVLDRRIAEERSLCDAENAESSRYYKLYSDFLAIYRAESLQSAKELERCYASDPCRLRQP